MIENIYKYKLYNSSTSLEGQHPKLIGIGLWAVTNDYEVSFRDDEYILKLNYGDGSTTL